jgi:MYXO-CTERM domain-containing protein
MRVRVRWVVCMIALGVWAPTAGSRAQDVDGDGVRDEFDSCNWTPAGTVVDRAGCDAFCQVQSGSTGQFFRTRYIEVGAGNTHSFGAASPPAGWRQRPSGSLGFVADPGVAPYTLGSPPGTDWTAYHGDFFTPGTPEEAWGVTIGGVSYNNSDLMGLNGIPGAFEGPAECVPNICGLRSGARSRWLGAVAGIAIEHEYSIVSEGFYILMQVTLTNTTSSEATVYYMRNVDPDNMQPVSGDFTTDNTIVSQAPGSNAVVTATTRAPFPSYLALGSADPDARVTFGGFSERNAENLWNCSGYQCTPGDTQFSDSAIQLSFRKTIPAGRSVSFAYAYTLTPPAITEAVGCTVPAVCGDGRVEGTEGCDDGNTSGGDGCSATCETELGWDCVGSPSTCTLSPPTITAPTEGQLTSSSPTIAGTCIPGGLVTIREAGVTLCTATCTAAGAFSCVPAAPLATGPHSITGTQSVGPRTSGPSIVRSFTVVGAPTITTPTEGSSTTSTTPPVTGTCAPGAAVTIREGASTVCTATCTAAGTFSCTPSAPLSYGPHAVTATQVLDGVTAGPSAVRNFTVVRCVDSSSTGTDTGCSAAAPHCRTTGSGAPVCEVCIDSATTGADLGCTAAAPFCAAGAGGASVCVACLGDADCNDSNACTTDSCSATGLCVFTPIAAGSPGGCATGFVCSGAPTNMCMLPSPTIVGPAEGAVTNPTPSITGTCVTGATVTVREGMTTLCTAVCADGTYACTPETPLAPGPHAVVATQTLSGTTSASTPVRNFVVALCMDTSEDGIDMGCSMATPHCVGSGGDALCVACTRPSHCDDGVACTNDSCSAAGACVVTSVEAGQPGACTDGLLCSGEPTNTCVPCVDTTVEGTDAGCSEATPYCVGIGAASVCVACTSPAQCDDGNPCTVDGCSEAGTCANPGVEAGQEGACTEGLVCSGPEGSPSPNVCVDCVSDAQCGGTTPFCNVAEGRCVPCASDFGRTPEPSCEEETPLCVTSGEAMGSCTRCETNADCAGNPAGELCDAESGRCGTRCTIDSDCPSSEWCPTSRVCAPRLPNGELVPIDEPANGECSEEIGARTCLSGVCHEPDDRCGLPNLEPCTAAEVCRSAICAPNGTCGECDRDSQCDSNDCDVEQGRCREIPDAGMPDAGAVLPDAGLNTDAGTPFAVSGGACGCRVQTKGGDAGILVMLGVLGLVVARRRRRNG